MSLLPTVSDAGGGNSQPRHSGDSNPKDDAHEHSASVSQNLRKTDLSETAETGEKINPEESRDNFKIPQGSASSRVNDTDMRKCISYLLKVSLAATALDCDADFFFNNGAAGKNAWEIVKQEALGWGVELTLSRNGIVQALPVPSTLHTTSRRSYPGDSKCYTLAETIEFVFRQRGSFAFAINMWKNQMVEMAEQSSRMQEAGKNFTQRGHRSSS